MAARIHAGPLDSDGKNLLASAMGHNGGTRRGVTLSHDRLVEIGRHAAAVRWNRHREGAPR
jgi:hypothetical protein